ncbi:MAG TPA: MobF family relaxase [Chthoniobacterales bacterium]
MLRITISHSAQGAEKYFDVALKTSDYYAKDVGTWGGRGAELLGLKGDVKRKDFVALANNRWPGADGERLTARMNKTRLEGVRDKKTGLPKIDPETGTAQKREVSNRRSGYDFTFSVPKSVSIYLAVNEDKVVEEMIAEALDETMAAIQARMETKVRKGYQQDNRFSPNLVYAKFVHAETRPVDGIPDPHYHVHVFAMNATFDEAEKEWKALEVGNTVGDRTFYEAHFNHLVAAKLEGAGYGIRRTEHHFELASVSRELVEKFSRRTRQIEQLARDKYTVLESQARALMKSTNMAFDDAFAHVVTEIGGNWDKWKSELGARKRESKGSAKYKARQELVTYWQSEMTSQELASLRPECVKSAPSQNLLDARAAKELAIRHLFEQLSLRRELHVAGMLLRRGIARVSIGEALAWVKSDPRFIRPDPDGRLLTTREVRDAENKMIRLAAEGQGKHKALNGGKEWVIRNPLVAGSEEQTKAVYHVLASKDFVISFKGPAGVGKTELMTEAVTAIESLSGNRVIVLAPSSPCVEVLRAQGFANANTLQQFQLNRDLQQAAIGQVLWVDEAGFLSVRQMLELQEFAVVHDCRLIVTGDTKQHHSVQWGDALRILERSGAIAQAVLTKIYRQRIPELREAIEDLSKGRTGEGFDKLDKFGAIREIAGDASRQAAIAEKQMEALTARRSSLIIAPTHIECRAIAGAVRQAMKEQGLLSGTEHSVTRLQRLNLTDSQQRDAVTYEAGQIVEFHRIASGAVRRGVKEKRFKSGEQWEVLGREEGAVIVRKDGVEKQLPLDQANKFCVFEREKIDIAIGDQVRFTKNVKHRGQKFLNNELRTVVGVDEGKIRFDKGEIVLNGSALHIDQGIAITSHASQAKTVDQVIISVPVRSFSQANEAQFYVSMSRARSAMHVFTDSKVALRDAVTRPSKRLSSWELVEGAEKDRALKAELERQRAKVQTKQQEKTYGR